MEFKVGDKVILVGMDGEQEDLYKPLLQRVGTVIVGTDLNDITSTCNVEFEGGTFLAPYRINLRHAKEHYLKKFKDLYYGV